MSDLMRSLIAAGLLSGTQPLTLMGLLVVISGTNSRRNGWAFIAGVFVVESLIVVLASAFLADTVEPESAPGRAFLGIRVALGLFLMIAGLMLRRPPKKPEPEVPAALEKLQGLSAPKSFIGGVLVADYVGPALASLALSNADVTGSARAVCVVTFLVLAIGIPIGILLVSTRSVRANERLVGSTHWVVANRRRLTSWIALIIGALLIADGAVGLLLT